MKNLIIESASMDELMGRLREVLKEIEELREKPCNETNELWTRDETAEFFQVSYQTLHNWKKNRILTPVHVGTRVYYHKSDIDNVIRKKGGDYEV